MAAVPVLVPPKGRAKDARRCICNMATDRHQRSSFFSKTKLPPIAERRTQQACKLSASTDRGAICSRVAAVARFSALRKVPEKGTHGAVKFSDRRTRTLQPNTPRPVRQKKNTHTHTHTTGASIKPSARKTPRKIKKQNKTKKRQWHRPRRRPRGTNSRSLSGAPITNYWGYRTNLHGPPRSPRPRPRSGLHSRNPEPLLRIR